MNQYLRRRGQHAIGKAGRKSETRLGQELGGRARPASGAMAGAKGDIALEEFLVEAKSTTAVSMPLKLDWLAKITHEALSEGKTPALAVSFVNGDGRPRQDGDWILIPARLFREITGG